MILWTEYWTETLKTQHLKQRRKLEEKPNT
jgi:hypothetical protein